MAVGLPTIRLYEESDFEAVAELWRRCELTRSWNDPKEDVALVRRCPNAEILVALSGEQLTGAIMVGHDGHRGWLYYLGVEPERRGQGIGLRLVREAEAWLEAQGIAKVQMMIRDSNFDVKQFYARLGYQPNPCHIMQRWLMERDAPSLDTRPDGRLTCKVTYLAMDAKPQLQTVHPPRRLHIALLRAVRPTVAFYRFLYEGVGRPWFWWERTAMEDRQLAPIIQHEQVEIYVLYAEGTPAGYFELDRREEPAIELAYFGLMPEFIGSGLGRFLLYSAVEIAWGYEPQRLHVNTNTLDHPKALALYQRVGFVPYRQETKVITDPRLLGYIPSDVNLSPIFNE